MQPQTASAGPSRDPLSGAATLILGDGAAAGLVVISRSLLRQICGQTNANSPFAATGDIGLLLGPEPQGDDLLIEAAVRLGSEYRSAHSLPMLLAGIMSVQPVLAEAQRKRSLGIVGMYRIAIPGQERLSGRGLELLPASGEEHSAMSAVRCCFVIVPVSDAEASVRVLMRKGEQWTEIHQIKLEAELPTPRLTSKPALARLAPAAALFPRAVALLKSPLARLKNLEGSLRAGKAASMLASLRSRDRFWLDATIITLLLLSLAANILMVWSVRHIPRQAATVNLQPLTAQIAELAAAVSKPSPPVRAADAFAAAPDLPVAARQVPAAVPDVPDIPPAHAAPVKIKAPEKRVSYAAPAPAPAATLAITKKPTILKPSEAFQFKVNGDPPPAVVWSLEGPGEIDPIYGLYRAPSQFTGEASVKITAKSRTLTQSVTFTLRGPARP
ncbi:MAG: hypothetical protein JO062_10650 [Bryobacterales bacterium]|nr:hypothetical protein [Bryobacterales bacterium]